MFVLSISIFQGDAENAGNRTTWTGPRAALIWMRRAFCRASMHRDQGCTVLSGHRARISQTRVDFSDKLGWFDRPCMLELILGGFGASRAGVTPAVHFGPFWTEEDEYEQQNK